MLVALHAVCLAEDAIEVFALYVRRNYVLCALKLSANDVFPDALFAGRMHAYLILKLIMQQVQKDAHFASNLVLNAARMQTSSIFQKEFALSALALLKYSRRHSKVLK